MKLVNLTGLPPPILEAARNRPYSRGEADISVTNLINPPRVFQLTERLGDKLIIDVADNMDALDGSAMHAVLEWAARTLDPDEWVVEKRWFADVNGWKVSGQGDVLRKSLRLLTDYKRCSRWVAIYGAKEDWEKQLNCLRWLAHKNNEKIDKLEVFAWFKDWSKTAYAREKYKGYPKRGWELIDIPVWPMEQAEAYILDRVKIHQAAAALPDNKLPLCTEEERWQRNDGYAIMVGDNKKATVVKDTKQNALLYIASELNHASVASARIEPRVGPPTRCIYYCSVREHCDFGRQQKKP